MAESRMSGVAQRDRRRWNFAGCVFDESNWLLTVHGERAPVEAKPLEVLRELLKRAGEVVTKQDLLDTIWPAVTVVEASLPTAVRKLRLALGDDRSSEPIIETVSGIGYRIAVPVEIEDVEPTLRTGRDIHPESQMPFPVASSPRRVLARPGLLLTTAALALTSAAVALNFDDTTPHSQSPTAPPQFTRAEVFSALRKTDVEAIERLLAAGWDPNAALDTDQNDALNILLGNCEWDRGHDQRRLLLAARTLSDGGARVTNRNAWGDTPYSIAKADRYCGPTHPVTKFIHMVCYEGGSPIGDRCLEDYRRDAAGKVIRRY